MFDLRSIDFQWPSMLWLLLLLPLAIGLYGWLLARRRRDAARLPRLETVGRDGAPLGRFTRMLPPLLLAIALCALVLAIARPSASLRLPSHAETLILALDMSGSMRATDIAPNRFTAAREAVKTFVKEQHGQTRIGVVTVAGTAALVQPPTLNREDILHAIERLEPQRGTAIGSGLVIALAALLPDSGIDFSALLDEAGGPSAAALRQRSQGQGRPNQRPRPEPVAPGSNQSVAIILLSDGESNTGPNPSKVIELAASTGVRIYTVGIGTAEGAKVTAEGWTQRVRLDEASLQRIAAATEAEYFRAGTAEDLKKVYRKVGTRLELNKRETTEVTALFAALGALLATLSAVLSMLWFNRVL